MEMKKSQTLWQPVTLVALLIQLSLAADVRPKIVWDRTVWNSADLAPGVFRIPLITYTPKGHLLAFSEARKRNAADDGPKFLATRRSEDKGNSWTNTSYIVDDGNVRDGLNLGAVVVDDETKHIFLIYTVCAHYLGCAVSSVMMVSSWDDGRTWSSPRNLSLELGTKMFSPGPGTGIQKKFAPHKGRLIVCGHGTMEENGVFCILSDDHGTTWKNGGNLKGIPYGQGKKSKDFVPDECQPYELPNGAVVINVRNQLHYHCSCRIIVHSDDGCDSLPVENVRFDEELIDPAISAGVFYKNGVTYFTNPASKSERRGMTLRWNSGHSWRRNRSEIWSMSSGYSCITSIPNDTEDTIYVIYEKGKTIYTEEISLVKIRLTK